MSADAIETFISQSKEIATALQRKEYGNDPKARLDFMMSAVTAAVEFLRKAAPGSDAHIPLTELRSELISIEEGRGSRILKSPKAQKGPTPSAALVHLQTYAVASINALIAGETKLSPKEAARLVAERIDKAGVLFPGRAPTHQQLIQWRTQMFRGSAKLPSQAENCRAITQRMLSETAPGALKAGVVAALDGCLADIFSAAHTGREK
jgi:hypothetical protein